MGSCDGASWPGAMHMHGNIHLCGSKACAPSRLKFSSFTLSMTCRNACMLSRTCVLCKCLG